MSGVLCLQQHRCEKLISFIGLVMFTRVHQDNECLYEHIYANVAQILTNRITDNPSFLVLFFSFRSWKMRRIPPVEISILKMMKTHLPVLEVNIPVHWNLLLTVTLMSAILKVRVCYSKVLRSFFSAFVEAFASLQRPFPTIYLSASNNSRNAEFLWALIMESFWKLIEPHFLFQLDSVIDHFMRSPHMFLPAF